MVSKTSYARYGFFALAVLLHIAAFLLLWNFVVFVPSAPPENATSFMRVAVPKREPPPPPPPPPNGGNQFSVPVAATPAPPPVVITTPVPQINFNAPKVNLPDFPALHAVVASVAISQEDSQTSVPDQGQGYGKGQGQGEGLGNGLGVQMEGLLFALPCGPNWICPQTSDSHVYLKLTDDSIHICTLRVRGLVEQATYRRGSVSGYLCSDGIPDTGTFNVYELVVDDSSQTHYYYLNAGQSGFISLFALDYTFDIQIHDGTKITLHADTIDGKEIPNRHMISIPDDDPRHPLRVKQPYAGQFIQIDAVSIK